MNVTLREREYQMQNKATNNKIEYELIQKQIHSKELHRRGKVETSIDKPRYLKQTQIYLVK